MLLTQKRASVGLRLNDPARQNSPGRAPHWHARSISPKLWGSNRQESFRLGRCRYAIPPGQCPYDGGAARPVAVVWRALHIRPRNRSDAKVGGTAIPGGLKMEDGEVGGVSARMRRVEGSANIPSSATPVAPPC